MNSHCVDALWIGVFVTVSSLHPSYLRGGTQAEYEHDESRMTVETLCSLRHGLLERTMDNESKELLDRVRANPERYAPEIERILRLPEDIQGIAEDTTYYRIGGAAGLAKIIGADRNRSMIHAFFDDLAKVLVECRARYWSDVSIVESANVPSASWTIYDRIRSLFAGVLLLLGETGDPHAVDYCLNTIMAFDGAKGEAATPLVMLQYIERVAPHRPDIRPKLEEMYTSETSKLRNHPQLKRALEAMDAAESAKAGESKPDGDADRTRDRGEDESDRGPRDRDRNK